MRRLAARLLLVTALEGLLPGCLVARLYDTPWPEPVERHEVRTADGWRLDLRRVTAASPHRSARPVVLWHGVVTNGRNCDLDERHSLARFLAGRGFDVWVPSLRGTGLSEHRDDDASPVDFDTYVTWDVPAVLGHVRTVTGASTVDWVGHSMGGLLLYAHLARGGEGVARAVTLGSPAGRILDGELERLVRRLEPAAGHLSWAPLNTVTRSTLPLQGAFEGPVERLLINRDNVTPETWRRFLAVGVDDVPDALGAQFAHWVTSGRFDSRDGALDYLEGLARVDLPIFVVAGKVDGIAPPWAVRPAYERIVSREKRWMVLGEANGQAADYNHMDMLLGERAAVELWGAVADFLAPATTPGRSSRSTD
jgi:pimeloyl-ACP methyl ester carboxylesterase